EANHCRVGENLYEQKNAPLSIWERGDVMSEEMQYLLRSHKLELREEDPLHYFNAVLWGAKLSAPADAVLVLYEVERDADGSITDIRFNFVAREEFEDNYSRCGGL
ncbi:MAG: hypothetical protein LUF30_07205, partial [Lachnospiraceae bacterium]|nr:hypothetical protein [Lachnospiraceae bacterium]